eukprot:GHUV01052231.1.p1 GENE.GHUV01052231.1~~GHUV01052231.1.p1  ORF type:complete len:152 (-),score=27.96 GHUV01052231.1:73-528(-)
MRCHFGYFCFKVISSCANMLLNVSLCAAVCCLCPASCTHSTHVNVISGSNGSGKSAVLQAIQSCLGVKAKDTGRGDNMKGFVRTGCHECKVQVGHDWLQRGSETSIPWAQSGCLATLAEVVTCRVVAVGCQLAVPEHRPHTPPRCPLALSL